MKILSVFKAASFALALAALTPSVFAVSETYIPSNAKFALFIDAKKAVASPALKTLLSKDGVNLSNNLDEVAMVMEDLTGDVSFFLTEIDPGNFEKSLMDVVLYAPGRVNAIYKRLAARDDIKTEASTFSGTRLLTFKIQKPFCSPTIKANPKGLNCLFKSKEVPLYLKLTHTSFGRKPRTANPSIKSAFFNFL